MSLCILVVCSNKILLVPVLVFLALEVQLEILGCGQPACSSCSDARYLIIITLFELAFYVLMKLL